MIGSKLYSNTMCNGCAWQCHACYRSWTVQQADAAQAVCNSAEHIAQGAKARGYKTYISCSIIVHSSSSSSVIGALAEEGLQLLVLDPVCRYLRNIPNSRSIQVFEEMN